ncbi:MAG: hypothetical protein AB7Q97_01660 [Gammaproteobacteria bacterium]
MTTVAQLVDSAVAYVDGWRDDLNAFITRLDEIANIQLNVDDILVGHQPIDSVTALLNAITAGLPVRPSVAVTSPLPAFTYSDTNYDPDVINVSLQKVLADLNGGGYGIDPADEIQLLDRAADREIGNAAMARDEIDRAFVGRGFALPPGTMFGALEKATQATQDAVSTLNRDIYVKRADQFVQARQFAIQQAGVLQSILIQHHANVMQRLLAVARNQLDGKIAALNAEIERARLDVSVYQTDGGVYSARAGVVSDAAKVAIGAYEANSRAFLGVVQARIENARNQLQAAQATATLKSTTSQAAAEAIATAIAGALNSINTIAVQTVQE